jgi:electron transfer flavoprotein alpha/beta subunit
VVLSKAISSLPHDLILCGTRAADTNSGLVGAVIAEILGISLVSEVTRINAAADGGKVIVHRKLEKGDREVIEVDLPALLTVEIEVSAARYASLPSLMAAQMEEIEELDLKALGLSSIEVGSRGAKIQTLRFSPPKPRRRKLFTPDASLSATEKIGMLMTGGITEKKTEFLEGEPKKIAATLLQFLAQQKLLRMDSAVPQERHES